MIPALHRIIVNELYGKTHYLNSFTTYPNTMNRIYLQFHELSDFSLDKATDIMNNRRFIPVISPKLRHKIKSNREAINLEKFLRSRL